MPKFSNALIAEVVGLGRDGANHENWSHALPYRQVIFHFMGSASIMSGERPKAIDVITQLLAIAVIQLLAGAQNMPSLT